MEKIVSGIAPHIAGAPAMAFPMSDNFDITLEDKLESNRDGTDSGVPEVRRIELIADGAGDGREPIGRAS